MFMDALSWSDDKQCSKNGLCLWGTVDVCPGIIHEDSCEVPQNVNRWVERRLIKGIDCMLTPRKLHECSNTVVQ